MCVCIYIYTIYTHIFHFNGETHTKQKKGDLHSVPAPEEALTTKYTG